MEIGIIIRLNWFFSIYKIETYRKICYNFGHRGFREGELL